MKATISTILILLAIHHLTSCTLTTPDGTSLTVDPASATAIAEVLADK